MMLYYIVKGNLLTKEFVENRTEGFEEFLNHINGLDIDHLASVAGVDKQLVKEAAIAYATAKKFYGVPWFRGN